MKKRKLLIDVGCGLGRHLIKFAEEGYNVIGVEKDPETLKKTKANVGKSKDKKFIKLINGDTREIEFDQNFDGVLFNFVLMFMPKKDALGLIDKYFNKLNDGGEMLIGFLMSDDPTALSSKKKGIKNVFYPKKKDLEKLKEKYGGVLKFKKVLDKPHYKNDVPHRHSIGVLKIEK